MKVVTARSCLRLGSTYLALSLVALSGAAAADATEDADAIAALCSAEEACERPAEEPIPYDECVWFFEDVLETLGACEGGAELAAAYKDVMACLVGLDCLSRADAQDGYDEACADSVAKYEALKPAEGPCAELDD